MELSFRKLFCCQQ